MLGALLLPGFWLRFPVEPPAAAWEFGRQTARAGRHVERALATEVRTLSTRFDGTRKTRVEAALWLGPATAARWLGWLSERERWNADEAANRWRALRKAVDGQVWILVQTAAYPSASFLELTAEVAAQPSDLDEAIFRLGLGDSVVEARGTELGVWRRRRPIAFSEFAWWRHPPLSRLVAPRGDQGYEPPMFPLGDYHCRWFLVRAPLPVQSWLAGTLDLVVGGRRSERRARFGPGVYNVRKTGSRHEQPYEDDLLP